MTSSGVDHDVEGGGDVVVPGRVGVQAVVAADEVVDVDQGPGLGHDGVVSGRLSADDVVEPRSRWTTAFEDEVRQ